MTIAACFLTPGGVVLGADSTSTIYVVDHTGTMSPHYFEHAQKLFEIGEGSTLGVVTWGLGAFSDVSYRSLFAELGDQVNAGLCATVRDVVDRFTNTFWAKYTAGLTPQCARVQALSQKKSLTPVEAVELSQLRLSLTAGFCVAGYLMPDRVAHAFEILFTPDLTVPPAPNAVVIGRPQFWGVPNIISRVIFAIDSSLAGVIAQSPHWKGSPQDLLALIEPFVLRLASNLPIREAIDYVHSVIATTCKGIKFSHLPPMCGGPAEIAVIATDRRFRWVTHKTLDEALHQ